MLSVENRQHLQDDGALMPIVERMVQCVAPGWSIDSIERGAPSLLEAPGWVVFSDQQQRGFAVNLEGWSPSRSGLRLKLRAVQYAQQIIEAFAEQGDFALHFTDREVCPDSWTVYQVGVRDGVVLCAVSLPAPDVVTEASHVSWGALAVAIPLTGYIHVESSVSVGDTLVVSTLRVECPEQRVVGSVIVSEEGVMTIQRDSVATAAVEDADVAPQATALVRLDIGEIELSLKELAALRAGTAIELSSETPVKCCMRVGATMLAQGELSIDGGSLVLKITQIVNC